VGESKAITLLGYSRHIGRHHFAVGVLRSADLAVIRFKKHFQVFYTIVSSITIYVVDLFLCTKLSSKFAFHQVAMNPYVPAVGGGHSLVVNLLVARLRVFRSAREATKFSSVLGSVRPNRVIFLAVDASEGNCMTAERVYSRFDNVSIILALGEEFSSATIRAGLAFGDDKWPRDNRLSTDGAWFGCFRHTMNVLQVCS
jgi:hypothetical protein